jgi:upstream activation factor subunit UAF30
MAKKKKAVAKKAPKKAKKAAAKKAPKKVVKKAAKKAAKKVAPKKAAPKKAAKPAPKKAAKPKAKRKPNAAFMAALKPSAALAAVVGNNPAPRTQFIKKIWDYIRKNGLQDATNKRMINADDKLKVLFGKDQVSMFELAKIIGANVSK